jgi:dienelactone hydrolase
MLRPLSRWRRASSWQRVLVVALGAVAVVVMAIGVHTTGRFLGWFVDRMPPAELSALLSGDYVIARPPGEGPFPTALLYHGCDGAKDNMARWSDALVEAGWAAITVDSHSPRGFVEDANWRLVCAGQLLPGPERAGDVLVSLADAAAMDFVDADRLALIGMSHGGWSIMELLSLDPPRSMPVNLSRMPRALRDDGLDGVRAVILVYPWCGLANRARHEGWPNPAPILFILARTDIIAPSFECLLTARTLKAQGHQVETIVFDGVTHGFDQADRSVFSPLRYDAEKTAEALDTAIGFLDAAIAGDAR